LKPGARPYHRLVLRPKLPPSTYLPLTQRVTLTMAAGPKVVAVTRYSVYERVGLNDQTERRLALDRHPGAKCSQGAHELTEKSLGYPNPCAK
jgi:hypothetical protein